MLLLSCQSFTLFFCEFYMSVNIVMLLGAFGVSRLHLEVYNCGRLSKTFFFITFTYYACCLIFFSDQVMRYSGWDIARKTKNSYSGLIGKCQEKSFL